MSTTSHAIGEGDQQKTRATGVWRYAMGTGNPLVCIAVVLSIIGGTILGYWSAVLTEQEELPGADRHVWVESFATSGISDDEVVGEISRLAEEHGANVYTEFPAPAGRTAYAAGPQAEAWISDEYRGLPGAPAVEVLPLEELPHGDYRQIFEISGDDEFVADLNAFFDDHSIGTRDVEAQVWFFLFSGTALGSLAGLLLVTCVALCVLGLLSHARADAVRRLHGKSLLSSAFVELGRALFPWGVLALAVVVAVDAALLCLFSPLAVANLIQFELIFCLGYLASGFIAVVLGLAALRSTPVVSLLAGRLPTFPVAIGVYLVRIGACLAVASLSVNTINYGSEWTKQHDEAASWESAPQAYCSASAARELWKTSKRFGRPFRNASVSCRSGIGSSFRSMLMLPRSRVRMSIAMS